MKTTSSPARIASLLVALTCFPLPISFAADTNSAPAAAAAVQPTNDSSTQTAVAPPKLPYGVEDVLKLSRAQVGDEITVNYIRNSGTIYALGPQDIVYLRNQGVSDRVINAMIDQRKVVTQATPAPQAPAIANAPQVPDASMVPAAPDYSQVAPVYADATAAPPASTVYVMPPASYSYPYYYGYPYYYYGGPVISFGFGYGRGYCYPYRGYYRGGYYRGGYAHGGGHWGGHR